MNSAFNPLIWIPVLLVITAAADVFADDLETRQTAYATQLELLQEPFQSKVEQLEKGYCGAAEKLQLKLQEQGDLEAVLVVKDELQRLNTPENTPGENSSLPALAALQKTYADALLKLEAELQAQQADALRRHLKGLIELQPILTKEGKIDEAVAVRDEIAKLKKAGIGQPTARAKGAARIPLDYTLYYSFDEKEEDRRVLDQSSNKFHGTSEKNGWVETGKRGGGFSGLIADTITIAHDEKFNSESFTIAAWMDLKRPTSHGRIFDNFNHERKNGYSFNVHELKPELELWGADGEHHRITIEGKLETDEWRHVAVTFQPKKSLLYINGELAAEKEMPEAIRPNPGEVHLLRERRSIMGGILDELMFYSRALSAEEVGHVMRATGKED